MSGLHASQSTELTFLAGRFEFLPMYIHEYEESSKSHGKNMYQEKVYLDFLNFLCPICTPFNSSFSISLLKYLSTESACFPLHVKILKMNEGEPTTEGCTFSSENEFVAVLF